MHQETKSMKSTSRTSRNWLSSGLLISGLLGLCLAFTAPSVISAEATPASAAASVAQAKPAPKIVSAADKPRDDATLSGEDEACQKCHDKPDIPAKTTEAGETLPMRISTKDFLQSMHFETSCTDCHENSDGKDHGKVAEPIKSKRDYRLSFQNACTTCHKKNVADFKDSVHAILVKEGSDKAPTCSDCHNSHTVRSVKLVEPIANVPCATCHKEIFRAYSEDVHGLERIAKGKSAPLCADCHKSHAIQAASFGDGIRDACLNCHKDSAAKHEVWLPNASLHFQAIECQVCHAPYAQRRVNLRMVDSVGGKQLVEKKGVPQFDRLTKASDGSDLGFDANELRNFLKAFNLENPDNKAILSGRLEVRSGLQAHQLSTKEEALKDCKVCHQAGAVPFVSVVLTMAGPDGRPLRQGVEKEVLTSATSLDTMRGFYAIGSTRIKLLDYLLVLVILGVLCLPVAHMTAHRLFKAKRDKLQAQRQQASKQ
jgi:predicted CXXCH cytochrome family protein